MNCDLSSAVVDTNSVPGIGMAGWRVYVVAPVLGRDSAIFYRLPAMVPSPPGRVGDEGKTHNRHGDHPTPRRREPTLHVGHPAADRVSLQRSADPQCQLQGTGKL
jgi:hypothetical protein